MDRDTVGNRGLIMQIVAKSLKFEDDGYCTVLAFADDPSDPENYVILQFTNNPTKQDLDLGQGGIHFELGNSNLSGYEVIKEINTEGDTVRLTLDNNAASRAGIDRQLTISLQGVVIDSLAAAKAVGVFQQRLAANFR